MLMGSLHLWDLCSLWTLLMVNDSYGVSWPYGVPSLMGSRLTLDPIDGRWPLWGFLALWDLCSLWTLLRANDAYRIPSFMGSLLTLDPIENK